MPIFDKVVAEANGKVELKDVLSAKIRDRKLQDLDEVAVERQVQTERTKAAEPEAKEGEAQARKINAETTIAEKVAPPGMWGLITEILKDRNPQAPMTIQDMMTIMEYARSQQAQAGGGTG